MPPSHEPIAISSGAAACPVSAPGFIPAAERCSSLRCGWGAPNAALLSAPLALAPANWAIDEGRVLRPIVPLIGKLPARDLRRADVQRMADAIAQGKTAGTFKGKPRGRAVVTGGTGTAARGVGLLGGIWSWAERRELVPGPSPTRGVETARGEAKDRILSSHELRA